MKFNNQDNIKRTEAQKLFHLIQQYNSFNSTPHPTINTAQISKFLCNIGQSNINTNFISQIDPTNRQLDQQNFSHRLAEHFQDNISNIQSLIVFNKNIRDLLLNIYQPPNSLSDVGMLLFQTPIYDEESRQNYFRQIENFHQDVISQGNSKSFQGICKKVCYVLSCTFFDYEAYMDLIDLGKDRCKQYFNLGIFDRIIKQITREIKGQSQQQECFKCLLLISEASKEGDLHKIALQYRFYDQQYWNIYYQQFQKYLFAESCVSTKTFLFGFIFNMIQAIPLFAEYLAHRLSQNKSPNNLVLNLLSSVKEQYMIRYIVEIYIILLRKSIKLMKNFFSNQYLQLIEIFAVKVLTTGKAYTCQSAIRLISQTVKHNLGRYIGQRDISIVIEALESNDINLISSSLLVYENGLKYNNDEIIWIFTRNKRCIQFITACLQEPISQQYTSIPICQCLQILYLMVSPQLITLFEQHGIINFLLKITSYHNFLWTFTSKLVQRLCHLSMSNLTAAKLMLNRQTIEMICNMMKSSIYIDPIMSSYLEGNKFVYFNKPMFGNCLASLYYLLKNIKTQDKFLSQMEIGPIFCIISQCLVDFLTQYKNQGILKLTLKSNVRVGQNGNIKFYKFIFMVNQSLIICSKNASIEVQKLLFIQRNLLLRALSNHLSAADLEQENIPLIIEYHFKFDEGGIHGSINAKRCLPNSLNYQYLKNYCLDLFKNQCKRKEFNFPIFGIQLKDERYDRQIRSQADYRSMIKRYSNQKDYIVILKILIDNSSSNFSIQSAPIYNYINNNSSRRMQENTTISSTISSRLEQSRMRNRSISPIRNSYSPLNRALLCEACHRVPCSNNRFCESCNKR